MGDAEIDEKEDKFTKKGPPVKLNGFDQPDIFPDDECAETQGMDIKPNQNENDHDDMKSKSNTIQSVQYNHIRQIENYLKNTTMSKDEEHYNSDSEVDEEEKFPQNKATINAEIEMQNAENMNSDKNEVSPKKGEMNDEFSFDENDNDGLGPLNHWKLINRQIELSRTQNTRKSQSEMSGNTFITIFSEEKKQIEVSGNDETDDDLEDDINDELNDHHIDDEQTFNDQILSDDNSDHDHLEKDDGAYRKQTQYTENESII